ncbi:hypothetical protein [Helicobacter sp. T3_23-1059]
MQSLVKQGFLSLRADFDKIRVAIYNENCQITLFCNFWLWIATLALTRSLAMTK